MKQDLARVAIELAVKRGIEDIRTDHKRSIRRLVDLGNHFANGRFHKYFFNLVQTMLEDEDSAYYHLVSEIVNRVDAATIATMGINIGYNSWTVGAKTIRANEAELGFNIPWAISFFLDSEAGDSALSIEQIESVLEQGKQLGIYSYILFLERESGDLEPLFSLFERQPDCAFALLHRRCATARLPVEPVHNVIQLFPLDEGFSACAEALREGGGLFGSYLSYGETEARHILSGEWTRELERADCHFAAAISQPGCPQSVQETVQEHINAVRANQQHAVFVCDLFADMIFVDRVISQEPCCFGVGVDGQTLADVPNRLPGPYNVKQHKLLDILSATMPKVTYQPEAEDGELPTADS